MCPICNGVSREEFLFHLHDTIEQRGFALTGCEGGRASPAWAYTIGLAQRFDHPEFVMVACDLAAAEDTLMDLATRVANGERFDDVASASTPSGERTLRDVHPAQLIDGALATCLEYYQTVPCDGIGVSAIQIVADDLCCDGHRRSRWDLSRAAPLINSAFRSGQRATPRRSKAEQRRRRQLRRERSHQRRRTR